MHLAQWVAVVYRFLQFYSVSFARIRMISLICARVQVGRYSPAIGLLCHDVRVPDCEPWHQRMAIQRKTGRIAVSCSSQNDGVGRDRTSMEAGRMVAGYLHIGHDDTSRQGSQSGLANEIASGDVLPDCVALPVPSSRSRPNFHRSLRPTFHQKFGYLNRV